MEVSDAYSLISRAIDTGRVANGYLVCGDLKTQCEKLTDMILRLLFPDALSQVAANIHPDVVRLEPEGRSRTIATASMREGIVTPMMSTSFSGGWRVGIIVGADRMQPAAANVFLKTLEEPPPKTLFLLLTDSPDALLPTIVSRCQRIDLPLSEGVLEGEYYDQVIEAMQPAAEGGVFDRIQVGKQLAEILDEVKASVEDPEVAMARKAFFKTVMSVVRKWMVETRLPYHQAFRNIEAVEAGYRQSARSMPDEAVLVNMTCAMVFPK